MVAKRFFYVCGGLLCLALAFHLGALSVHAQVGGSIDEAEFQTWSPSAYGFIASGVVGREFHLMDPDGSVHTFSVPIPGAARVVAMIPSRGIVMLENGDILQFTGTDWKTVGNLLGGATATHPETLGSIKARYR